MPLLSYAEAAEQIQLSIQRLRQGREPAAGASLTAENVALAAATGRVLARPVLADRDQPPFHRATRDGFAVRAAEANQFLALTGQIRAGQPASGELPPGEVWEIMTGAAVPSGADAVFMVEHAEYREGLSTARKSVRLTSSRTLCSGDNIVPRGAEAHAGQELIPSGTRLTPAHIALAAQCGYAQVAVYPRPRVAILSTGDELVRVEDTPGPHQIRNSNSPMLAALVTEAGAEPVILPAVLDQQEPLDAAIQSVVDSALNVDMLLVSGGISAGRFDLVDQALIHAGATFIFRGLAIQPGKPLAFGELAGTLEAGEKKSALPFFALPGNPISSAVTFHLFAAPILAALAGESATGPGFAQALLAEEWQGKPGLTRFLPAFCDFALNPVVRAIPWQGSGDLAAFARSNCCLVIPADTQQIPAGSPVQILLT